MDVSRIMHVPSNRSPVDTEVLSAVEGVPVALRYIRAAIGRGEKVFWVCTRIRPDKKNSKTMSAQERWA